VAPWVPDDFWREWRKTVKATDPQALTVAETWFDSSKFFLGDSFDSTMNYIFRSVVLDYAMGGNAKKLYAQMELMRELYPKQAFYALMNLLSSHDQARSLHVFGWHGDEKSPDALSPANKDAAAIALAKQRLKFALAFQMMYPGSPAIYYGDEVGMSGGDDPYNRGTYPWADLGGKPDNDMLGYFKQVVKLRNDHPILRRGTIDAPLFADDTVIVLLRRLGNEWALTATHNGTAPKTVSFTLPSDLAQVDNLQEVFSGDSSAVKVSVQSKEVTLMFKPGQALFIKR
jgi:cyclomaltodextrinase / maltogenic alpha-amylase / neopullulanase